MCDRYTFVCLKYKGQFCDSYIAEFHMLKIVRQILTITPEIHLLECLKVVFCHDYKVKFLNKMCSINCHWLKETLWHIFMGNK